MAGKPGDVSMTWLVYVDDLLNIWPDAKFVCLRRKRKETIRSWEKQMEGRKRFGIYSLFQDLKTKKVEIHNIFPDFGDMPLGEAAARFYDAYYEEADRLQRAYPNNFRIFESPKVLVNAKLQRKMFKFCGIRAKTDTKVHLTSHSKTHNEFRNRVDDFVAEVLTQRGELTSEDFDRMFELGRRYFGAVDPGDIQVRVALKDETRVDKFVPVLEARL
jgi:hypothetical protein